jgi:hypothetical protein
MTSCAYRLYDIELPLRVPGVGVGIAISKFKQIGVWDKFPCALKDKAKEAKGTWIGSLKITQKDLDSIPDDAWKTIAVAPWRCPLPMLGETTSITPAAPHSNLIAAGRCAP